MGGSCSIYNINNGNNGNNGNNNSRLKYLNADGSLIIHKEEEENKTLEEPPSLIEEDYDNKISYSTFSPNGEESISSVDTLFLQKLKHVDTFKNNNMDNKIFNLEKEVKEITQKIDIILSLLRKTSQ